jgi:tetratricopeptide (TPR) repeat protein
MKQNKHKRTRNYHKTAIKHEYSVILTMPHNLFIFLGLFVCLASSMSGCENSTSTNTHSASEQAADTSLSNTNPEISENPIEKAFIYARNADARALELADSLIQFGKTEDIIGQGHYLKGIYYTNTNESNKALLQFDSTIITNFTFTDAYLEKAILLYDKKKFDLALDLLKKAAELNRYDADIYFWMAKNYESLQNEEEAFFYYQQTLLLDKNYGAAKDALDGFKKIDNPKIK